MHGGRLVHYSISLADGEDRPELIGQLDASAATLREHNPRIPAVVFLYGRPTAGLAAVCRAHGLMLHEQGPYEQRLAELCPAGWPALARYPLLHRFLNFRELAAARRAQALYSTATRSSSSDVERLFDRYARRGLAAREEVHTRAEPARDGPRLRRRGAPRAGSRAREGAVPIAAVQPRRRAVQPRRRRARSPPRGAVRRLRVALRAVDGAAPGRRRVRRLRRVPRRGRGARRCSDPDASRARCRIRPRTAGSSTRSRCGSRSATCPDCTWPTSTAADVAENGEFSASEPRRPDWVVCHYYSQNTGRIDAWLRRRRAERGLSPKEAAWQPRSRPQEQAQPHRAKKPERRAARPTFPDRIFGIASPRSIGGVSMFEPGVLADASTVGNFVSEPEAGRARRQPARRRRLRGPAGQRPDDQHRRRRASSTSRRSARSSWRRSGRRSSSGRRGDRDLLRHRRHRRLGPDRAPRHALRGGAGGRRDRGARATRARRTRSRRRSTTGTSTCRPTCRSPATPTRRTAAGITGRGIVVAMVDTGWQPHPFFTQRGYRVDPVVLGPGTADPGIDGAATARASRRTSSPRRPT